MSYLHSAADCLVEKYATGCRPSGCFYDRIPAETLLEESVFITYYRLLSKWAKTGVLVKADLRDSNEARSLE
jgi:hypothetical protein